MDARPDRGLNPYAQGCIERRVGLQLDGSILTSRWGDTDQLYC